MQALNKSHGATGITNGQDVKKWRYGTLEFGAIFIQDIASEHAGQLTDVLLCVGLQWLSVAAHFGTSIDVELCQANGEQLHDFAGVVFIRLTA